MVLNIMMQTVLISKLNLFKPDFLNLAVNIKVISDK